MRQNKDISTREIYEFVNGIEIEMQKKNFNLFEADMVVLELVARIEQRKLTQALKEISVQWEVSNEDLKKKLEGKKS